MNLIEIGKFNLILRPENSREGPDQIEVSANERKRRRKPIIEFEIPKHVEDSLSKEQAQLLNELRRVGRRVGDLYLTQEDLDFWPQGVSDSELEETAKENPLILSPYTYVLRDNSGALTTIPIHEVFQREIKEKEIAASLKKAEQLSGKGKTRDLDLQIYLRSRRRAFENGNWESSESLWLQMPNLPKVFIVVGPYDSYLDRRKIKYAWEGWVGVLDNDKTKKAQEFVDKFLAWWEQETEEIKPKITARVDHTVMMFGQAERKRWTGNSLPCQMDLRKELGSIYFIFDSAFEDKFREQRLPAFRLFVHHSKRSGVKDDKIRDANWNRYNGHETSHPLVAEDMNQRLKGSSAWVKELYCDLLALKGCFALSESKREKELLFATTFVNGIVEYFNYQSGDQDKLEYLVGNSIMLNYCLKHNVISIENGIINWLDAEEVIKKILDLFEIVDEIQKNGSRVDSHSLHQQYYNSRVYERFRAEPIVPSYMLK